MRTERKDEYGLTSSDYSKVDISGFLDAQKMAKRVLDRARANEEAKKQKAQSDAKRAELEAKRILSRDDARNIDTETNPNVMAQVADNVKALSNLRGSFTGFRSSNKTDNRQREFIPKFIKRSIIDNVQKVLNDYSADLGVDSIQIVNDGVSLGSLKDFKDVTEITNGRRVVHKNAIGDGCGRIGIIRSSNDMYSVNVISIEIGFGADKGSQTFRLNLSDLWNKIRAVLVHPIDSPENINNMAKKEYLALWNSALTTAVDKRQSNMLKTGDISVGRVSSIGKTMTSHGVKDVEPNKIPTSRNDLTSNIVNGETRRLEDNYLENKRIYLLDGLAKMEKVYYCENRFRHLTFRWVDVYAS